MPSIKSAADAILRSLRVFISGSPLRIWSTIIAVASGNRFPARAGQGQIRFRNHPIKNRARIVLGLSSNCGT
jgi:hypothetical protein